MVAIALPLVPVLAPNVAAGAAFVAAGSAAYIAQGAYLFRRGPAPLPPLTGLEGVPTLQEMIADFAAGARVPVGFPLPPPLPPNAGLLVGMGAAAILAAWKAGQELTAGMIRYLRTVLVNLLIQDPPDVQPMNDRIMLIGPGFSHQAQDNDKFFRVVVTSTAPDKIPFPPRPGGYTEEQWPSGEFSPTGVNTYYVKGNWFRLGLDGPGRCTIFESRGDSAPIEASGAWILEKTPHPDPNTCQSVSPEKKLFQYLNLLQVQLEIPEPRIVPTRVPLFRPLIKPVADPVTVPSAPVPQLLPAPYGVPRSPVEVLTGTPVQPPRPVNRWGWTGNPLRRDSRLPSFPGAQPYAPATPDGPGLTPNEVGTGVGLPAPAFPALPPLIQPLPKVPQKTGRDGKPVAQPQPRPKQTRPGTHVVGTQLIPDKGPRPDLVAIASEVGRLEQKTARILKDGPQALPPNLGDLAGLVQQVIQALVGLGDQGSYSLGGPCERDEQGNPIPFAETVEVWEWGGSPFLLQNIAQRVDALAEMMQKAQLLRQPTCKNPPPVGELVSVQFREVDP